MFIDDDIEQLKERKICFNCVGEDFLKAQISNQGILGTCSYCGQNAKSYSIDELSEFIETAFNQHYRRTSDQPTSLQYRMLADKESDYDWERDGEPVVYALMNAADIPEDAASDIQIILEDKFSDFDAAAAGEETEFSSSSYYEESGTKDERWQDEWRDFEQSLKTETRFFSRSASRLLASVFDGVDKMWTRDGRPLIVEVGPETKVSEVFRARSFQSDQTLKDALARPDMHLGSPPSVHAHAGRMNAHGISVFYGANSPIVALAEIRPPVGSKVIVARFDIIRSVRLLDLTALSAVTMSGSIFDPTFITHLERMMFLRNLSSRITIPVMPEHEMFEYLPTQAIADFLAAENNPPLDGIIFPSVQAAGEALNFVLFHKAARVEAIELPTGTEVDVSLGQWHEDGWEDNYTVFEEVPPKKDEPVKQEPTGFWHLSDFDIGRSPTDSDTRPLTLKIDLDSLCVHSIKAVQFHTLEYPVSRYRWEKAESKF